MLGFPVEFMKSKPPHDFISPCVNFIGNAALVGAGSIGLGAITFVALKALGYGNIAAVIASATPVAIGALAFVAAGGVALSLIWFINGVIESLGRR